MLPRGMLPQLGTITRFTAGSADAMGQPTETWATLESNVPCRIIQKGGREVEQNNKIVVSNHLAIMNDRTIDEQDRLTVDSVTYNILVKRPQRGPGHAVAYLELDLEQIR